MALVYGAERKWRLFRGRHNACPPNEVPGTQRPCARHFARSGSGASRSLRAPELRVELCVFGETLDFFQDLVVVDA
jgi:hypothetical protein